jgi:hypothetical protein
MTTAKLEQVECRIRQILKDPHRNGINDLAREVAELVWSARCIDKAVESRVVGMTDHCGWLKYYGACLVNLRNTLRKWGEP